LENVSVICSRHDRDRKKTYPFGDRDKADAKRRIQVPNNEQHGGVYACTN
jgi:hypothetical protein